MWYCVSITAVRNHPERCDIEGNKIMPRKLYTPAEKAELLAKVDAIMSGPVALSRADALKQVGISESNYYNWKSIATHGRSRPNSKKRAVGLVSEPGIKFENTALNQLQQENASLRGSLAEAGKRIAVLERKLIDTIIRE
jgi:hypothetical protein